MSNLNNIVLSKKQTAIAIGIILLIITSLGLRTWFDLKSYDNIGPEFIVSNDRTATLVYDHQLYRLDDLGNINQTIALDNIAPGFNTADLQLLDDQRFVIADWNSEQIFLCAFSGPDCKPLTINLGKNLRNHFKFHYRDSHKDIFIADTDNHRVIHYDTLTHKVSKTHGNKAFLYPNHLQIESDGYLYVTDTNHHRISRYEISKDNNLVDIKQHTHIPRTVTSKKWPIFFYRLQNDDLFVLQGNDVLSNADLLFIGAKTGAQQIQLPVDTDITVMSQLGYKLLLLDRKQFAIHALDIDSFDFTLFGSPELNTRFAREQRTMAHWSDLSDAMMGLLVLTVVGMVGFIIYLAISGKRNPVTKTVNVTSPAHANLPPITPGVVTWLEPNPFFRKIFLGIITLIIALFGLMFFLYQVLPLDFSNADANTDKFVLALGGLGFVLVLIVFLSASNIFTRVGTDGVYIYLKQLFNSGKVDPATVMYTRNYLVSGKHTLVYRNNQGQYFQNREQFETYIQPLIETHGKKVGLMEIFRYKLSNPSMMDIINAIFAVIGIYIIFLILKNEFPFF